MSDLSLADLSKITRTHVVTLRRLAHRNKLPGAYRLGGKWMFRAECVPALRGVLKQASELHPQLATAILLDGDIKPNDNSNGASAEGAQ